MLNDDLKMKLISANFPGTDFSLTGLILGMGHYFKTLFRKDDGTFGCAGPMAHIGYIDGEDTPEDAMAKLWLRLSSNNFNVKVRKKVVKKAK